MKDKVKNHILKYIRKYISLAVAIVVLPFLSVNSFAFTIPLSSVVVKPDAGVNQRFFIKNPGWNQIDCVYDAGEFSTEFNINSNFYNVEGFGVLFLDSTFTYSYNFDAYDYYFSFNLFLSNENSSFSADRMELCFWDVNGSDVSKIELTDFSYNVTNDIYSTIYQRVFSCIGKIPSTVNNAISFIEFYGNGQFLDSDYNEFTSYVYQVPKGTSAEEVNALITAINNQTNQLGGQLEGIDSSVQQGNELIENGTDETQQAVTDFNEVFEDFNTQLEEIESFETQFTEDWNSANETYLSEISQFTMPYGVINAGNWLSTSMQTVYDNSDDYKMLWLVPLLLGVPLVIFFFKRGDNSE